MKKTTTFVLLFVATVSVKAQLKVSSNGHVGINATGPLRSSLTIGGNSSNSNNVKATAYLETDSIGLYIKSNGNPNGPNYTRGIALQVKGDPTSPYGDCGILSTVSSSSPIDVKSATGISGAAGNTKLNYGVSGRLTGTRAGAAIRGEVANDNYGIENEMYAGSFKGDVEISSGGLFVDSTYKSATDYFWRVRNDLDSALAYINELSPIGYVYPSEEDLNVPLRKKQRYMIPGENMKAVFPSMVKKVTEDYFDYYYVDYAALIPVLVKAIKQLNQKIARLERVKPVKPLPNQSVESSRAFDAGTETIDEEHFAPYSEATLYQNTPNPFSSQTQIHFTLPDDAKSAYIYIFDMTGKMQKQIAVNSSMESVTINGYELSAGIYLYSLVVNGQEVDTKRMILSK